MTFLQANENSELAVPSKECLVCSCPRVPPQHDQDPPYEALRVAEQKLLMRGSISCLTLEVAGSVLEDRPVCLVCYHKS
jgi:hypothetical protein